MKDQYFVTVQTFSPKNNKCRAFIKWVETLNNSQIIPGPFSVCAFATLAKIVKNHCIALDKENSGSAPFKVFTAGSMIVVDLKSSRAFDYNVAKLQVERINSVIEVNNDDQLDVAYYSYRFRRGGES